MLLRDDETEQPQIPQALNELGRLLGREVPALEVLMLGPQELVDGIDHHPQNFPVFVAQTGVGKEPIFDDLSRHEIFRNAHRSYSATRSMTRFRTPSRPTS